MRDAMARAKKDDTKHVETSEDRFVERILQAGYWLQHHARTAILATIALTVVALGAMYFRDYRQTVRERAATELESLRGITLSDPNGAAVQLESFVNRFRGTVSAEEGRLLLATVLLNEGRTADAIAALQAAREGIDTPAGHGAKVMLAAAFEDAGDLDAALAVLDELANSSRYPFQQREAQAQSARIMAQQGRLAEAAAVYASLADGTENLAEQNQYRIRLGEIQGRSTAPALESSATEPSGSGEETSEGGDEG